MQTALVPVGSAATGMLTPPSAGTGWFWHLLVRIPAIASRSVAVIHRLYLAFTERLRHLSGLQGDGAPLVDSTCSLSSGPLLAFNTLSTEWERSEQTGLATLLKGLFGTFRNLTAHAPKVL